MMPVLLHIGPFTLGSYAVALGLAFLLGGWVLGRELERRGLEAERAGPMTLLAALAGVGGATLLALLEDWLAGRADVTTLLRQVLGMTWYGGFVAGAAALYGYSRWHRLPFRPVLDASAPALMLGYGIGRLGCHFAGDGDYGMPTSLPWGVSYAAGVNPPSRAFASISEIASAYPGGVVPDDIPCHPVPVYECVVALAAFGLLSLLSRRPPRDGSLFSTYLVIAGGARFAFEALRLNPPLLWGLTEAPLNAIALVMVGTGTLTWSALSRRPSPVVAAGRGLADARGRVAWPWPAASVALLLSGMGCTQTTAFHLVPGDPNNTIWVGDVRFEPPFVRDTTQKIGPSYVYWTLAGEPVFVKWLDFHAHVMVSGTIWDCNLCAEKAAQARGGEICPLPGGQHPRGTYPDVGVQFFESLGQTARPFLWSDGCFTLGPPDTGPSADLSFTVSRSATWFGLAEAAGTTYRARRPFAATFWGVGAGGHLVMPPHQLQRYVDPATAQPDANHWVWKVGVTTDANGKTWWDESFSPGITVERVRLYTGRVVTGDPFVPDGTFVISAVIVPRRIGVYTSINPQLTDPFGAYLFRCASDPAATASGGDIDITQCRGDVPGPSTELVTPAYQPSDTPPATPDVRTPLTWVAEFNNAFPAPVPTGGDDLWIEFTLRDTASVVH